MDGDYTAFTFTSIVFWRIKRDARVRWESPDRGQRQPLFGCRRQRDKTLNKVSKF